MGGSCIKAQAFRKSSYPIFNKQFTIDKQVFLEYTGWPMASLVNPWADTGYQLPRDYTFLGKGSFGYVCVATKNDTGSPRAAKLSLRNDSVFQSVREEAALLEKIGPILHVVPIEAHFQIVDKAPRYVIISPLVTSSNDGSTRTADKLLKQHGMNAFSTSQIISSIAQMTETLIELKKRHLTHGDLKPENLIINRDSGQTTTLDMGNAVPIETPAKMIQTTRRVCPPESLLKSQIPSPTYDMWSLGVTFFELYTDEFLFFHPDQKDLLLSNIFSSLGEPKDTYWETCQYKRSNVTRYPLPSYPDWRERLCRTAQKRKDPAEFSDRMINFLERIFCYENRMTPEEALEHDLLRTDCHMKLDLTRLTREQKKVLSLSIKGLEIPLSSLCSCIHFPVPSPNDEIQLINTATNTRLAALPAIRKNSAEPLIVTATALIEPPEKPLEEEKFTLFTKKTQLVKKSS